MSLTFDDEGIEVVAVGSGEQALSELEREVPDIVLADVHMPAPNGYELCARIKRDARTSHVPVMLLVGSFEPFDEAEARKSGADEVLTKPFQSIRDLVNKVSGLLGGHPEASRAGEQKPPGELRSAAASATESVYETPRADPPTAAGAQIIDSSASFADLGADDESIQTTPADAFAARGKSQMPTAPAGNSKPFAARRGAVEDEFAMEDVMPHKRAAGGGQDFAAAAPEPVHPHAPSFDTRATAAAAADDALLELGDMDTAHTRAADDDDFVLDMEGESYQAPGRPQVASESAYPAAGESAYGDAVPSALEMQGAGSLSMAEPSVAWSAGDDFAVSPEAVTEPVAAPVIEHWGENFSASGDEASRATTMTSSASASTQATSESSSMFAPQASPAQGAAQLSPENIDAIARRVVELLSDKIVREIAWEVVPDLADRLIRRKLEEEKTRSQ